MLRFAGPALPGATLEKLHAIHRDIGSNNRYQGKDLTISDDQQLPFVRDSGFEVQFLVISFLSDRVKGVN